MARAAPCVATGAAAALVLACAAASAVSDFGLACVVAATTILASAVVVELSLAGVSADLVVVATFAAGCVVPVEVGLATGGGGRRSIVCGAGPAVCSWMLHASCGVV